MAKRVRGFETAGDMLRSLAVVGVFVVALLVLTLRSEPDGGVKAVDTTSVVAAVQSAAPFAAKLPAGTPAGWTPTSARVTLPTEAPYSWYLGYSTDTGQFVAVTQRFGDPAGLLDAVGAQGEARGTVKVDGATWDKFERKDGSRRSLVSTTEKVTGTGPAAGQTRTVTTVVVGTAPYKVLERTAAALRPART